VRKKLSWQILAAIGVTGKILSHKDLAAEFAMAAVSHHRDTEDTEKNEISQEPVMSLSWLLKEAIAAILHLGGQRVQERSRLLKNSVLSVCSVVITRAISHHGDHGVRGE
jgi:hypothetical protein